MKHCVAIALLILLWGANAGSVLADSQKSLPLYEAPHDARNDHKDSQADRSSRTLAEKRRGYDTWASVIFLCYVVTKF
jgi:hypothetical protein